MGRRLREAADELCDGDAAPLVLALVQKHRFTAEELARFHRLLDEARAEAEPPGPAARGRKRTGGEGS